MVAIIVDLSHVEGQLTQLRIDFGPVSVSYGDVRKRLIAIGYDVRDYHFVNANGCKLSDQEVFTIDLIETITLVKSNIVAVTVDLSQVEGQLTQLRIEFGPVSVSYGDVRKRLIAIGYDVSDYHFINANGCKLSDQEVFTTDIGTIQVVK